MVKGLKGIDSVIPVSLRYPLLLPFFPHSYGISPNAHHNPNSVRSNYNKSLTVFGNTPQMFRMFRSIVVRSHYVRSLSVQSLSVPSQCRQHQAVSICPRPHKKSLHYYLTTEPHRVTLLERDKHIHTQEPQCFTTSSALSYPQSSIAHSTNGAMSNTN